MNANTPQPLKTIVNGNYITVNPLLKDFEIIKKASTNVDYFAIRRESSQLFIQFSNGKCFMYEAVPQETLEAAKEAESIGKFFHSDIKGKYETVNQPDNCIAIVPPTEDDEDLDEEDEEDEDYLFDIDGI